MATVPSSESIVGPRSCLRSGTWSYSWVSL